MARTLRYLRGSLIALAAIVAASTAAGEASACSTIEPEQGSCATACGCCLPATSEAPTVPAVAAERAAMPRSPLSCATVPGGGCCCRSGEPAAPAPKPARSAAEGRTETGPVSEFVPPGEDRSARISPSSQLPLTESPPKIPLYLRNERLLF